jgi:hypothetical protein
VQLLTDTSELDNPQYMTLSHRWGDPTMLLKLTDDNAETLKKGVDIESLPYSYRDAIRITLALGCHYLWIDSLCIIQGSKGDFEAEGTRMATIYGAAVCNISYVGGASDALAPSKSSYRDPRLFTSCLFCEAQAEGTHSLVAQGDYTSHNNKILSAAFQGPLFERAWVFQERLLCTRTIYYGGPQLIWECMTGFQTEFMGPSKLNESVKHSFLRAFNRGGWYGGSNTSPTGEDYVLQTVFGTESLQLRTNWSNIVSRYLRMQLTKESDRVIALAGITERVQSLTGFTPICGVWKQTFVPDLCWTRQCRTDVRSPRTWDWSVPSWSWYAIHLYEGGAVRGPPSAPLGLEKGIWENLWSVTTAFCGHAGASKAVETLIYAAKFMSCDLYETHLTRPTLHFKGAKLTVYSYLCPVQIVWKEGKPSLTPPSMDPKWKMEYWHDEDVDEDTVFPGDLSALLIVEWAGEDSVSSRSLGRHQVGMVIAPLGDNLWRRRGIFDASYEGFAPDGDLRVPCLQLPAMFSLTRMVEFHIDLL